VRKSSDFWTDDRVETLRRMWSEGASARDIGTAIHRSCTRNMVIGKAHRLGLEPRQSPIPAAPEPARTTVTSCPRCAVRSDVGCDHAREFGT
jgi:GcrA cell cycle regulator